MAIDIFQGEDKTVVVKTNIDLTGASEIQFNIDTPTMISKTLTAGQITGVTNSQFTVQIDAADTATVPASGYKYQARATLADGKIANGRFRPNKLTIRDSLFVTQGQGKVYG